MIDFDEDSLNTLQNLCKIKLTEEEKKLFVKDLKKILEYSEKLNEVKTDKIDTCNYILKDFQKNVFREDIVDNSLSRDKFLSNAPQTIAAMVKVYQTVSKGEKN